jgi:DNA-binding transcriptional ArsR family regulator
MASRDPVPIEVIAAVHHPARRRILDYLQLHDSATVGGIAAALDLQVGSVSHHLKTLEQAALVEPDAGATGDRRQSWWRAVSRSISWSTDDFTGAERQLAEAAEVENLQHQLRRVIAWLSIRQGFDPAWVSAAFSTDQYVEASPAQLAELGRRINALLVDFAHDCKANPSDDQVPVFVLARGVPAQP